MLLAAILTSACSGVLRGTITDAETGRPIPGAVFVVQWTKRFSLLNVGPQHLHRLEEAATDEDGHFEINAGPGLNLNPFRWVNRWDVCAYAPGYYLWPNYYPGAYKVAAEHLSGADGSATALSIDLRPIESPSRAKDEAHLPLLLHHDAPRSRIPLLVRAVNGERRRFGLPLYPAPD
jgi:hypothetical protein